MTKSELIQRIAENNPHLYQRDIEIVVNTILEEISDTLTVGGRVELRGFGIFEVRERPAKTSRNPRTGEKVKVDRKFVPAFRISKILSQRLNSK